MKKIFITATNTDIGKTYTTKLLLKEYAKKGFRVGVIKPIETGVVNGNFLDGFELFNLVKELNSEFRNLTIKDIVPISFELPAAPYIASGFANIDIDIINKAILKLENYCDLLLIEGAGGLYVPINRDYMMIDLIKELNVATLLVTHCSLGCINDTLLSKNSLDIKNIKNIVAFNCKTTQESSFNLVSKPYFQKNNFNILEVNKNIDTISELLYNL